MKQANLRPENPDEENYEIQLQYRRITFQKKGDTRTSAIPLQNSHVLRLTLVLWLPSMRDGQVICMTEQDEPLFYSNTARVSRPWPMENPMNNHQNYGN